MQKGFKFRIYPNSEQKLLINKTFGFVRKVYQKKKKNTPTSTNW